MGSPEELAALQQNLLVAQEQYDELKGIISTVWLLGCAALVYFMQAGFAMVEVGACRINHALSILVKNQVDFLVSCVAWYLVGWGLGFGDAAPTSGFLGTSEFFGEAVTYRTRVSDSALLFHFQQMFCTVAATIVSGGIAERADLKGYVLYTFAMSSFIYPVIVCWCWNGDGWLASQGFSDFAGSGVVHLTGGMGALAGAWVLGPRIGRFGSDQQCHDTHEFQPHNVPFIALGTMVLHFGWYGFNAGSILALSSEADTKLVALASVNTTMSAIAGGVVATLIQLFRKRVWDVPHGCNGILAGLVAVTASCHAVNPPGAMAIGCVGGVFFSLADAALHWLRIDDPVGAFPVHGAAGIWGVIAGSLFHRGTDVLGMPVEVPDLSVQFLGALAISGFSGAMSLLVFGALKKTGLLGTTIEDQRKGLDRKFGDNAYGAKEVSRYRFFVSHAKSTHGATARWVQLELARHAKGKSHVFLDSDNLVNLSNLLGTVHDKVDVLVVLASRDIWWRPWCAGEIAVASLAGVPIVLLMVQEDGRPLELDFDEVSGQVRDKISPEGMECLTPFGIDYENIERAYSRLAARPQVPFGPFPAQRSKRAISQIAGCVETSFGRLSPRLSLDSTGDPAGQLTHLWAKGKPNYLVICDREDIEAVAASHICEKGMLEVANRDPNLRVASGASMTEAEMLQCTIAGATLIFVLSKHVLECPSVQRVCLLRAAALWPDGFAGCSDVGKSLVAVTVNSENLGFEYPSSDFYKKLQVIHRDPCSNRSSLGECSRDSSDEEDASADRRSSDNRRRSSDDRDEHVAATRRSGDVLPAVGATNSVKLVISMVGENQEDWSGTALPCQDDEQAAVALSNFYRALFQPIAMPLSTHGSWRTIAQQMESVCERAREVPRVQGAGSKTPPRIMTPRTSIMTPRTINDMDVETGSRTD